MTFGGAPDLPKTSDIVPFKGQNAHNRLAPLSPINKAPAKSDVDGAHASAFGEDKGTVTASTANPLLTTTPKALVSPLKVDLFPATMHMRPDVNETQRRKLCSPINSPVAFAANALGFRNATEVDGMKAPDTDEGPKIVLLH